MQVLTGFNKLANWDKEKLIRFLIVVGIVIALIYFYITKKHPQTKFRKELIGSLNTPHRSELLKQQFSFNWTKLCVINSYTPDDKVSKLIGHPWQGYKKTNTRHHDSFVLFLLLKNNKVIASTELVSPDHEINSSFTSRCFSPEYSLGDWLTQLSYKTYVSNEYDFSISYPQDYETVQYNQNQLKNLEEASYEFLMWIERPEYGNCYISVRESDDNKISKQLDDVSRENFDGIDWYVDQNYGYLNSNPGKPSTKYYTFNNGYTYIFTIHI
jgi:hypothetical protein